MTTTITDVAGALAAVQQRIADAEARAAVIRARAATGDSLPTDGADLAAVTADVELAALAIPAIQAQAKADAEVERQRIIAAAAADFAEHEPEAAQAFRDAIDGMRTAVRTVRAAAEAHAGLVAQLAAVAKTHGSELLGEPVKRAAFHGDGLPSIVGPNGYRKVPTIDAGAWLDRLSTGSGTADLYPGEVW